MKIIWNDDVLKLEGYLDESAHWIRPDLAPGTAAWYRRENGHICHITFICPCGCSSVYQLPVSRTENSGNWQWDGNEVEPTLTPSILLCAAEHIPNHREWHGHLTKGEFKSV